MNATAQQRAQMIRLAIAANVDFALDESDLAPDASGYTANLLRGWPHGTRGRR